MLIFAADSSGMVFPAHQLIGYMDLKSVFWIIE